ncbi:MAG TPA: hypothetical protein VFP63_05225 [Dehalococcoidia bacterium]|nr:hypothetical protein [Dehalococcoidia bacterium]
MSGLAARTIAFGVCIIASLAYGIVNEMDELPDWLDRAVLVASVLGTGILLGVLNRRFGISLFLGAPFLSVIWTAAAFGGFVPFALGLEGRVMNNYDYDMAWEVRLMLDLFVFALAGLGAGLLSAAVAFCVLTVGRLRTPRRGSPQPLT